jgi:hypothetical protein
MSERRTRPIPDRAEPIRAWSDLLRTSGDASLGDVVSRSVELGYRVVDEYIRQGQQAAQRVNARTYGPAAATSDLQDLAARMARYTSDFLGLWLEFVDAASRGDAVGRAAATATEPAGSGGDAECLRIVVVCARPTEVSLDLRPKAGGRPLVVHALRAVDPAKPALSDVVFSGEADGSPATVRVEVPADQPEGIYSGLLVDEESNRPVGTLSVRVATAS